MEAVAVLAEPVVARESTKTRIETVSSNA